MKAVLMSTKPKWCARIASGEKTIEIRKTKPKLDTPFKVYIYCTKQKINGEILLTYDKKVKGRNRGFRDKGDISLAGKVIGEFVCNEIDRIVHCGTCNNDIQLNIVDENLYCQKLDYSYLNKINLFYDEIDEYSNGYDVYAWHISDLVIYDNPKALSEFFKACDKPKGTDCSKCIDDRENICNAITRPPQSWCYVESEVQENDI